MARVVICARSPASSEAVPCLLASTVKRMGCVSVATTLLRSWPACACAKCTSAARWAALARWSTISTALAGKGLLKASPRVALARTTAATFKPSRETLSHVPLSTCHPRTASWPVRLSSEFAKHGPVETSAVRDSMYSPDTCPAGWAALAQEGRATNAPARSNDDAARFTFIVAASVDWPKDFFEPQTYFPTPTFSIQIRIFDSLILACQNSNANRYAVSQHERPGRHLSVLAKPPSGPIRDCVCAHQKGPVGIIAAFS